MKFILRFRHKLNFSRLHCTLLLIMNSCHYFYCLFPLMFSKNKYIYLVIFSI